jgi:Ca2+-binding EF-hand superfamily protein
LNGDAVITIDEFKTLFKIDETDLIDVQSALELFHFMDTNGDGRITKQDEAKYVAIKLLTDKSGDNRLIKEFEVMKIIGNHFNII